MNCAFATRQTPANLSWPTFMVRKTMLRCSLYIVRCIRGQNNITLYFIFFGFTAGRFVLGFTTLGFFLGMLCSFRLNVLSESMSSHFTILVIELQPHTAR